MRKWIAGLLALTALSPVAAGAQDVREGPGGWRGRAIADSQPDRESADAPSPRRADGFGGRSGDRGPRADAPRADASRADARPDRGGPDDRADRAPSSFDQAVRGPRGGDPDRAGWQQRREGGEWRQRSERGDRPDRGPRAGTGWQRPGGDRPTLDRSGSGRPDADWQRSAPGRPDAGWRQDRRPDRPGWQTPREARPDRDRGGRDDWTRSRFDDRGSGWWSGGGIGNRGGWDRGWRNDRRYDWNRYRVSNRDAFRLPRYYAPYGWSGGYRRFAIGAGLSASLWSQGYWIDDPYAYRLPEAYGPYRWVRYYDDALLVDLRTGVVIDAAYGIFW